MGFTKPSCLCCIHEGLGCLEGNLHAAPLGCWPFLPGWHPIPFCLQAGCHPVIKTLPSMLFKTRRGSTWNFAMAPRGCHPKHTVTTPQQASKHNERTFPERMDCDLILHQQLQVMTLAQSTDFRACKSCSQQEQLGFVGKKAQRPQKGLSQNGYGEICSFMLGV